MALARIALTVGGCLPVSPMGLDQYRSLRFDTTGEDNDVDAFGAVPDDLCTLSEYLETAIDERESPRRKEAPRRG